MLRRRNESLFLSAGRILSRILAARPIQPARVTRRSEGGCGCRFGAELRDPVTPPVDTLGARQSRTASHVQHAWVSLEADPPACVGAPAASRRRSAARASSAPARPSGVRPAWRRSRVLSTSASPIARMTGERSPVASSRRRSAARNASASRPSLIAIIGVPCGAAERVVSMVPPRPQRGASRTSTSRGTRFHKVTSARPSSSVSEPSPGHPRVDGAAESAARVRPRADAAARAAGHQWAAGSLDADTRAARPLHGSAARGSACRSEAIWKSARGDRADAGRGLTGSLPTRRRRSPQASRSAGSRATDDPRADQRRLDQVQRLGPEAGVALFAGHPHVGRVRAPAPCDEHLDVIA
jgi:hypothetical protein